ncbi:alpha/beta hydrolase [Asticcacaulis sp. BYS171W]|uniref:Alpha/beta hydrolase n=1 Tax=Asticcacaulis aquaticus TaxID=2984212 RepID=A0ABT5HPX3_9CAUL|nr:alpha/beta hydrolase [Asticcacaulis aquaticus]MDC7682125.1 alpha/beta hydrolase [Asticcacaulis aquaticus]
MATKDFSEQIENISRVPGEVVRRLTGTTRPRLAVFRPKHPNGKAILIIPGGGFATNYFDPEGYMPATVFASKGYTCFVLFYRLADNGWQSRPDVGTVDAQRALRLIKSNASRFNIDPEKVGAVGFSAGGFVVASLATRFNETLYDPTDPMDSHSSKPAFIGLAYGVLSLDPAIAWAGANPALFGRMPTVQEMDRYSPDQLVTAQTPPVFLTHAEDDKVVVVENSLRFRAEAVRHGVRTEMHIFATGGHGFRKGDLLLDAYLRWPSQFMGFIDANV